MPVAADANKKKRMLGTVVYYAMLQHEVEALQDRKELVWTAYVAKIGTGVFSGPRFFFSSRRLHTSSKRDWSSDVCSSDLGPKDTGMGSSTCTPTREGYRRG